MGKRKTIQARARPGDNSGTRGFWIEIPSSYVGPQGWTAIGFMYARGCKRSLRWRSHPYTLSRPDFSDVAQALIYEFAEREGLGWCPHCQDVAYEQEDTSNLTRYCSICGTETWAIVAPETPPEIAGAARDQEAAK